MFNPTSAAETERLGLYRPIGWYDDEDRVTTHLYYRGVTGELIEIASVVTTSDGGYLATIGVDGSQLEENTWEALLRRVDSAFWYGLHELVAVLWDDPRPAVKFVTTCIEEGCHGA